MIPDAEAIAFLAFIAGWGGGALPVYLDGEPAPSVHVRSADRLAAKAAEWDGVESRQVEIGLPSEVEATLLWCWLETRDQVRRGRNFRPLPSLVLQMGSSCRRLCLWAMHEQVPWISLVPSNRKIAYRLRAPQKYADPGKLRIPLPGTFLRVGRKRPAPVVVTRMSTRSYNRTQVVATLRDPPPPWHVRQRERGLWR